MYSNPITLPRAPRLGSYGPRESIQAEHERCKRISQMRWLQAVNNRAPAAEVERLAKAFFAEITEIV